MVSHVSLLDCELCLSPDNTGAKDIVLHSSSQENDAPHMPVKKQTRQWAAWTRQEEESFFAALRQVGKNFEKITCRVQSKNKDQVRYYYYRVVRRMNKLLGPELSLDAKNSKDTNAAMLRWWSLLEKYSCKSSKLHLKPRRFKIFVETLENQLLKDRKKNIKKRLPTEETNHPIPSMPTSNQVKPPGHDSRYVKPVLVDNQNIPKVGTGKGASFKRNINMETGRNNCKVDPSSHNVKPTKLRRKTGPASAAAYKRWEKAAIAGVSLVADAAEHLERVDTNKQTPGRDGSQLVREVAQKTYLEMKSKESDIQNSIKLKLQLFPIDEGTRKALEMDNRNPHLELTLSPGKKISSILEHLNRKWGNSSSSSQELILFPYWAQRENLMDKQKWTKDSNLCAVDVFYSIGSPSIFRLRYGWFSKAEIESVTAQVLSSDSITKLQNSNMGSAEQIINITPSCASTPVKITDYSFSRNGNNGFECHGSTAVVSSLGKASGDLMVPRQAENTMDMPLCAGEWADSFTNISMGDLLSESAHDVDSTCADFLTPHGSNCLQQIPFSCDSFDAAIAAHIYEHQHKVDSQQGQGQGSGSNVPSIWYGDETCDAFAFKNVSSFRDKGPNATCTGGSLTSPLVPHKESEELSDGELMDGDCGADNPLENSTKHFGGLTDMYWPESLGPLDLDIAQSCRHNNELIFGDNSLGGLNRLIANSIDGFQSCSFFGSDKKGASSSSEARQSVCFPDFQVPSEA